MTNTVHFFLGANSGNGYQSLFGQLTEDRTLYDMVILKGPPGTGKSTFLKLVGEAMEAVGTAVEYIHCAGAPDSLDGVLLPELRCALADGTAPHLLEPRYPLAVQRCLDLGRLCDITAAKAARDEVIRLTDGEASAYGRAFHALKAARQVELDTASAVRRTVDWARLERRVEGIARRELRQRGTEAGTTALRFLGTMTHQGPVWRFDTLEALCPRVYELADSCGLAGGTLEYLRETAAERGWNTVACPAPEEPDRLEHLLIPGLGLAFVTSHPGMEWPGKAYRRLRLDAMAQRVQTWSDSHYRYTKTDHYRLEREGDLEVRGVPTDGLQRMSDDMMDALEPFDYSSLCDFQMSYLSGYFAERYDVDKEASWPRAQARIERSARALTEQTLHGYLSCQTTNFQTSVFNKESHYAMLPVWLLSTQYKGKNYLFAMNGQTGKMVGKLPLSYAQLAKWFGICGGLGFLLTLIGGLLL